MLEIITKNTQILHTQSISSLQKNKMVKLLSAKLNDINAKSKPFYIGLTIVSKPTMNTNTNVEGGSWLKLHEGLFVIITRFEFNTSLYSAECWHKLGKIPILKKISFHTIRIKNSSHHSWMHELTLSLVSKHLSLHEGVSCSQSSQFEVVLWWRLRRHCSVLCWWLCLQGVPRAKRYNVKLRAFLCPILRLRCFNLSQLYWIILELLSLAVGRQLQHIKKYSIAP